MEHPVDSPFFPESLEDEGGTDLLCLCLDALAPSGQHHKHRIGETGKGTNEAFNISLLLELIHAAHRRNNPLDALSTLPAVFYNLEILVLPGLLDSRKHGAPFYRI